MATGNWHLLRRVCSLWGKSFVCCLTYFGTWYSRHSRYPCVCFANKKWKYVTENRNEKINFVNPSKAYPTIWPENNVSMKRRQGTETIFISLPNYYVRRLPSCACDHWSMESEKLRNNQRNTYSKQSWRLFFFSRSSDRMWPDPIVLKHVSN